MNGDTLGVDRLLRLDGDEEAAIYLASRGEETVVKLSAHRIERGK
jgi:hypothetical protein